MKPRTRQLVTPVIVAVTGAVSWSTAHAGHLQSGDPERVPSPPREELRQAEPGSAHAIDALASVIDGLAGASDDKITESVTKLGVLDDPQAIPALDALMDDRLRQGADGHAYLWDS